MTIHQQIEILKVLKEHSSDNPQWIWQNVEFQKLQTEFGEQQCMDFIHELIQKGYCREIGHSITTAGENHLTSLLKEVEDNAKSEIINKRNNIIDTTTKMLNLTAKILAAVLIVTQLYSFIEMSSLKKEVERYQLNENKYKVVIAKDSIKIDSLFSIIKNSDSTVVK